jgi:hypothetical protein
MGPSVRTLAAASLARTASSSLGLMEFSNSCVADSEIANTAGWINFRCAVMA